jgi:hypothetical protein
MGEYVLEPGDHGKVFFEDWLEIELLERQFLVHLGGGFGSGLVAGQGEFFEVSEYGW